MIEVPGSYRPAAARLRTPAKQPDEPVRVELPSGLVPVHQLPAEHPAAAYLRDRQFDLAELAERWHISYCEMAPTQPPIFQRIVIPIHRLPVLNNTGTELVGWQARAIGDAPPGVPKYLFAAGFRKSRLLYGLPEAAKTTGAIAICEGPADVWRFGTNAVALFGKSMSDEQCRLLHRHFADRDLVIALDNDATDEAQEIEDKLRVGRTARQGRVLRLELPPEGKDPADFTREMLWALLKQTGATITDELRCSAPHEAVR